MDATQVGIIVSLFSMSIAVLKISRNGNGNNKSLDTKLKDYVPREVCHLAMKNIADKQDVIKIDIDEIKQDVKTLLKNGK